MQFYAAEIVLALDYLHEQGIMYRNLKTNNILLDSEGHVRLTNFQVSKAKLNATNGRTKTMIKDIQLKDSTPKSNKIRITMPPEMSMKNDETYGYAVDWYSLGMVIYHMLTGGEHPFREFNQLEESQEIRIKDYFSDDATDLIY